jgi:hypothetical protein
MNRRTLLGSGTLRALAGACLVLLAATVSIAPRIAFAQANPVAKAQQQYDNGDFAEALATVKDALSSGAVSGSEAVAARELMARCQAKTGDVEASKKTFLQILHQDPQYRLDEVRTPPDEVVVFRQALQIFLEEEATQGQRIPASIEFFYGVGSGDNEDFGEYVALGGGDKKFDNKPFFGLGVRFPLKPKWSLNLELQRFRATNEDTVTVPVTFFSGHGTYELTATPLIVSAVYLLRDSGKFRTSVFAGGGPMLNSYASDSFTLLGFVPLKTTDSKVGVYFHGGVEGEYLLHPKLSVTARGVIRYAKASKMFEGSTFTQYATGDPIGDRDLDFSGYGISIGLRGYIGY